MKQTKSEEGRQITDNLSHVYYLKKQSKKVDNVQGKQSQTQTIEPKLPTEEMGKRKEDRKGEKGPMSRDRGLFMLRASIMQ